MPDTVAPANAEDLAKWVQGRAESGRSFRVVGSKVSQPAPHPDLPDDVLTLSGMTSITDYPADDMTITVEAGMSVASLHEALTANNQQLPLDVGWPEVTTVGDLVSADLHGLRRYGYGTARDYLIGLQAVDGHGRLFHSGGRVVKNVAGYDLCRLVIGSRGTLCVLTQLTLKLKPNPGQQALLVTPLASASQLNAALARMNVSECRPVALQFLCPQTQRLVAGLEPHDSAAEAFGILAIVVDGLPDSVDWQRDIVSKELREVGLEISRTMMLSNTPGLFSEIVRAESGDQHAVEIRAGVPPTEVAGFIESACRVGLRVSAMAGNGVVCCTGTIGPAELAELRSMAERMDGYLHFRDWGQSISADIPRSSHSAQVSALRDRIRHAFDPKHVLNPHEWC